MKVVLQKVSQASVSSDSKKLRIDKGYCLLVGVSIHSTEEDCYNVASKIAKARNFEDSDGKINLSIQDVGGEILSISQFTLYADVKKGNRPSFTESAKREQAKSLYESFNNHLRDAGLAVTEGFFGEHMVVDICNDGPITIIYESQNGSII